MIDMRTRHARWNSQSLFRIIIEFVSTLKEGESRENDLNVRMSKCGKLIFYGRKKF
jgi:hypothetical protein